MDVAYEDRKLHNDGIFDTLMGYKEWFHYQGTFSVHGDPLTFVLGFPKSYTGMGAFGWISYEGNQYSLAGNTKDVDHDGFYDLETTAAFKQLHDKKGYTLQYETGSTPEKYKGFIEGVFPRYTIDVKTPDLDLVITMEINSPQTSVAEKKVFEWMPCNKRFASWFHSGDITISLAGTVSGSKIDVGAEESRGWYERMWSKVVVLWPSEWFWFMVHLDNGDVFDLYIAKTMDTTVHPLDECWLYDKGIFYEFFRYNAHFPRELEEAIKKRKYSEIIGKCITCRGENEENSFEVRATITDFRQYEFNDYSANIKYTNFLFDTEGEAVIDGKTVDMKGQGAAERAPMLYWWL